MKKLLLLVLLMGCASGPTPKEYIQLTYYRATHKVLVFVPGPNGTVGCWVKEKDLGDYKKIMEQCVPNTKRIL